MTNTVRKSNEIYIYILYLLPLSSGVLQRIPYMDTKPYPFIPNPLGRPQKPSVSAITTLPLFENAHDPRLPIAKEEDTHNLNRRLQQVP